MLRAEVAIGWKTQAGHRHQLEGLENEDAVWVTDTHPLFDAVLMVADGMGGHPRPREASRAAVETARQALSDPAALQAAEDLGAVLSRALERAHRAVRALGAGEAKPPGTTLSIAVAAGGALHVAHVGDGSVYLMRGESARGLAGGEDRRSGNRPAQFLGQPEELEPEVRQIPLSPGDRILLCTDGLTRYFREAGAAALERVLGREGVTVAVIASQLTAHSRPDDYDDDTTVALMEVVSLTEAPRAAAVPKRERDLPSRLETRVEDPMRAAPARGFGLPALLAAAVVGAVLLAVGFFSGRASAPAPASPGLAPQPLREVASPEALATLPAGNLILLDELNRRVFALPTRPVRVEDSLVKLQAFRVAPNGRLTEAGSFQLDAEKGELRGPDGTRLPVETDYSRGVIRVLRGGVLQVNSRPSGAAVTVDGTSVGATPQKLSLPAGVHRVRVEGRTWSRETEVDVPASGAIALTLGAP